MVAWPGVLVGGGTAPASGEDPVPGHCPLPEVRLIHR